MDQDQAVGSVLVTGGQGNLGQKLAAHLRTTGWCERIVLLDREGSPSDNLSHDRRVASVEGDLGDRADRRWREAFTGIDAVVHLAAQNPYPDASWGDAVASFDMTANVLEAAATAGVRRLVFASSNHVMGQYKDPPLAAGLAPGGLRTSLEPGPGTRWFNGERIVQGSAYAVSKLMGERACLARAELSGGALTCVALRIGWCQPGENRPDTINAAGLPGTPPRSDPDADRDLKWFRDMWLSNRDFVHLVERALIAPAAPWPGPGIVVNGMSANRAMPWDIETTRRLLGYAPRDDIWEHVS